MTTHTSKITVDEFWAMAGDPGHRYELVDGELVDMDGTPQDSVVSNQFGRLLGNHVAETGLPLHVETLEGSKWTGTFCVSRTFM
jgi:hypothetical protein